MLKYICIVVLLVLNVLNAQIPNRYVDAVFTEIVETNNEVFSQSVPQPKPNYSNLIVLFGGPLISVLEYDTENVSLAMDIFEPENDLATKRPVVIICFGGGFVQGSRDYWSIRLLAQGLARRGYVTATIDYRLGMSLYDQDLGARAVYRGVQDGRSAVRFFRANAAAYNIDPEKIFIGGHSAGAFIALHNLYLDKDIERPDGTRAGMQEGQPIPDQDCLDCVGDNLSFNGKANGVFSLAGAVGDPLYIESGNDEPPLLFHSSDDPTVPFDTGKPFSNFSGLIVGSDLPTVYGSIPISERCTTLGISSEFNTYSTRGHAVHENGSVVLHSDILPKISTWFNTEYLKPVSSELEGDLRFCGNDLSKTYTIEKGPFTFFDWTIEGGEIMSQSSTSESVNVIWDENASNRQLSLTPYSENGAQGDSRTLSPLVVENSVTSWIGSDGNWDNPLSWSTGAVPLTCEDVVIPENAVIEISEGVSYSIQTLTLNLNATLTIPPSSELKISQE